MNEPTRQEAIDALKQIKQILEERAEAIAGFEAWANKHDNTPNEGTPIEPFFGVDRTIPDSMYERFTKPEPKIWFKRIGSAIKALFGAQ